MGIRKNNEDLGKKILIWALLAFGVGMFLMILYVSFFSSVKSVYHVIGINIILGWITLLLPFYAWSVHFYNVNLGLTDSEWEGIRKKYDRGEWKTEDWPTNPFAGETLGLPKGTIRGTLSLTVTVGALAMLVASFDMENQLSENSFFIDNMDFFKTAFLMVIAFYFGHKSIEAIAKLNPIKGVNTGSGTVVGNTDGGSGVPSHSPSNSATNFNPAPITGPSAIASSLQEDDEDEEEEDQNERKTGGEGEFYDPAALA